MKAEIIFNTPDPRVALTFPGFQCAGIDPESTLMISGLPLAFAQEMRRRWNAWHEPEEVTGP
jgi:hypothetical protein